MIDSEIDVHQHLIPEAVLGALAARDVPPYARRNPDGTWTVTLAGEDAFVVDPSDHKPERRRDQTRAAGVDIALVALSTALGVDELPADEALGILDAWAAAAAELPEGLHAWAAVPLRADPVTLAARTEAALEAGAVGVCVPAEALAIAAGLQRLTPVLDVLERRGVPLFVHPGAVPAAATPSGAATPAWWAASTTYVAGLHAAWLACIAHVRPAHPDLRVLFAALAGLAPLHAERVAARGGPGPESTRDPGVFYDTSSYGPRAVAAMTEAVGADQIVDGSDHPVLPLPAPDRATAARAQNASRLLSHRTTGAPPPSG